MDKDKENKIKDNSSETTITAAKSISFFGWPLAVTMGVFALDQASKLIVDGLFEVGYCRNIIPGLFNLVHYRNTGCAWGMLSDHTWILALVSLAAFAAIAAAFRKWCDGSRLTAFALGLLQGGILGNMIDRGLRASVIDFLDFYVGNNHWPAFNIADSAICVAVGILLVQSLFLQGKKDEKDK